jgi:methionine aminotransferase
MSGLASKHQAINLGQGFPDFSCDRDLISEVNAAMLADHNQYPPMTGIEELRNGVAQKIASLYGHHYDPETEITITAGGTQGIMTAILSCVGPSDEVVIIEPAYDSYRPSIDLAGGKTVAVSLITNRDEQGHVNSYSIPWDNLANAITLKTRLLIINTPHNPTGMTWERSDLDRLAKLLENTNALLLSDEVYEHMVFDGQQHQSIARHKTLLQQAIIVSSFGKTVHTTGWKIGYVAGPKELMAEFRKAHQFLVFAVNHPFQLALADFLAEKNNYLELKNFYQEKRDYFLKLTKASKFIPLITSGTYFQLMSYRDISDAYDVEFAIKLTKENKLASIPLSVFYTKKTDNKLLRFCFAKKNETLERAAEILCAL